MVYSVWKDVVFTGKPSLGYHKKRKQETKIEGNKAGHDSQEGNKGKRIPVIFLML